MAEPDFTIERMNLLDRNYPLKREQLAEGVWFGSIADSRFKTNLVTVNLIVPLRRETVTENALIPIVLEKCWEEAPTNREFAKQLNRLYGASVGSGVMKLGNSQVLTLSFAAIDSRFALNGEDLLKEAARILLGMLFRPVKKDGLLEEENLSLQAQYLIDTIQADINEKRSYAINQTVKRMFEGEPSGLPRMGFVEDAKKITPASATAAYERLLKESRVEILHVGMGDPSTAKELFRQAFAARGRTPAPTSPLALGEAPQTPREYAEEKPVNQAKLCMGFRTGVDYQSPMLSAMRLMNAVLGGCTTSKLFVNVREKRSLCYYCASRMDRIRGILLIDSGVDREKAEETKTAILEELDAVRRGDFTGEELEFARLSLLNSYRSVGDSTYSLDSFYLTQTLLGVEETPEEQGEKLMAVTKEQVMEAANMVKLDTVYLLSGPESQTEGEIPCENQ